MSATKICFGAKLTKISSNYYQKLLCYLEHRKAVSTCASGKTNQSPSLSPIFYAIFQLFIKTYAHGFPINLKDLLHFSYSMKKGIFEHMKNRKGLYQPVCPCTWVFFFFFFFVKSA